MLKVHPQWSFFCCCSRFLLVTSLRNTFSGSMEEGIYIVPASGLCGPLKVSVLVGISAEVLNPLGLAIAEKLHLPALYTDMGRDNFEPV